ncbi:MAG TPA: cyclic nucleotide-binding domain-containing protein [Anaerolineaceae bacterium]
MSQEAYADLDLFQGLTAEQLRDLDSLLVHCHYPQGTTIFEQGQAAANLYILTEGEVVINYKPYDGPVLVVARIQTGGVFGWSAALGRDIYTSSAQAACDCAAYCVSGMALQRFCSRFPDTGTAFLERLASGIARRLNSTHTEILSILSRGMCNCNPPGIKR